MMKGYMPDLKVINQKELNSKTKLSFIELGVKQLKCEENCECDKCKKKIK